MYSFSLLHIFACSMATSSAGVFAAETSLAALSRNSNISFCFAAPPFNFPTALYDIPYLSCAIAQCVIGLLERSTKAFPNLNCANASIVLGTDRNATARITFAPATVAAISAGFAQLIGTIIIAISNGA